MDADLRSRSWISYDSVAATYERVAVPRFAPMAEHLVSLVAPTRGERFVDLGTGTGLVATMASHAVLPNGLAIGIDPSVGMLARVSKHTVQPIVAKAPGLPLADSSIDAVAANFVLSHISDLAEGIRDIARALRAGGRFGATAWAPDAPGGPENDLPEAIEMFAAIKAEFQVPTQPPRDDAVPLEEWLHDEGNLRSAFEEAGFGDLLVERRRYSRRTSVHDLVSGWDSHSRYARQQVGPLRWEEFTRRASDALLGRFGETFSRVEDVWFVVGHRG